MNSTLRPKTAEQKFQERCLEAATKELNKLKAQHQDLLNYVLIAATGQVPAQDVVDTILRDYVRDGAK